MRSQQKSPSRKSHEKKLKQKRPSLPSHDIIEEIAVEESKPTCKEPGEEIATEDPMPKIKLKA